MAAGIIGRRNSKHRRGRRTNQLTSPISIASATKSAALATIVFNQPVSLNGVPAYKTDLPTVHATAASMTSPTTLVLTFSAAITSATTVIIPFNDPAIRNSSGGYANAGSFPL
jgi:hypothetical protein